MNEPKIKPLLAAAVDPEIGLEKLKYPLLCSPKIDGIRCLMLAGRPMSRSLKPIRNRFVQETLCGTIFEGLDGELTVGSYDTKFQETTSGIMSEAGTPDFTYWVFDCLKEDVRDLPFHHRLQWVHDRGWGPRIKPLAHHLVNSPEDILRCEEEWLPMGYEGVMLRDLKGRYKFGRSTLNEGILLKLKRFVDDEATIIGFEERNHNDNPATISELGYTKRSAHQSGKRPAGDLGKLVVTNERWGEFRVGSGFDAALRITIWNNREAYLGKLIKYKYQAVGIKDKPRTPIFLGFRDPSDL